MIIDIHFMSELLELFGNSRPSKESRITAINNNEINRFHANDVGFFDSFYDNKTVDIVSIIEHFNKNTYF